MRTFPKSFSFSTAVHIERKIRGKKANSIAVASNRNGKHEITINMFVSNSPSQIIFYANIFCLQHSLKGNFRLFIVLSTLRLSCRLGSEAVLAGWKINIQQHIMPINKQTSQSKAYCKNKTSPKSALSNEGFTHSFAAFSIDNTFQWSLENFIIARQRMTS